MSQAIVDINGIVGDIQADPEHHGGIDQAVCLYSVEIIEALQAEGHPISAGSTGENLTISGLDWDQITPGKRIKVGQTLIETTDYTTPCSKITGSFSDGRSARIHATTHPGWGRMYAKVLISGSVHVGDDVEVLD